MNKPHPNCAACRGAGYHTAEIRNLGTLCYETHIVPCDHCGTTTYIEDTKVTGTVS